METKTLLYASLVVVASLASCGQQPSIPKTRTQRIPIEVASIHYGEVDNLLTLFGSSLYLKRNVITSPIPSFIYDVQIKLGDQVKKGDVLYVLESKERRALGQQGIGLDKTFDSLGIVTVRAPYSGIISTLDKQQVGDYVLEGNQLCTLVENNNLAIQISVPFENAVAMKTGKTCTLELPDGRKIPATITTPLTTMNTLSQTQNILAKPGVPLFLPENLIVKVMTSTYYQKSAPLLPVACVLSDEMMSKYWIMKLVNDSTAVRVPVTVGEKSGPDIQILLPEFNPTDRIISKGNYGLPDTVMVSVGKPEFISKIIR